LERPQFLTAFALDLAAARRIFIQKFFIFLGILMKFAGSPLEAQDVV
jgi:hypothetical protein